MLCGVTFYNAFNWIKHHLRWFDKLVVKTSITMKMNRCTVSEYYVMVLFYSPGYRQCQRIFLRRCLEFGGHMGKPANPCCRRDGRHSQGQGHRAGRQHANT